MIKSEIIQNKKWKVKQNWSIYLNKPKIKTKILDQVGMQARYEEISW